MSKATKERENEKPRAKKEKVVCFGGIAGFSGSVAAQGIHSFVRLVLLDLADSLLIVTAYTSCTRQCLSINY